MGFAQRWDFIYVGGGIDPITGSGNQQRPIATTQAQTLGTMQRFADLPSTALGRRELGYGNVLHRRRRFRRRLFGQCHLPSPPSPGIRALTRGRAYPNLERMKRTRMGGAVLNGAFYAVGGRSYAVAAFIGTPDNQRLELPGCLNREHLR